MAEKDFEKDFVNYKTAILLKDMNFNRSCLASFKNKQLAIMFIDGPVQAPLKSQVFRWFRDNNFSSKIIDWCNYKFYYEIIDNSDTLSRKEIASCGDIKIFEYNTYQEAEDACILALINAYKLKNKIKNDN